MKSSSTSAAAAIYAAALAIAPSLADHLRIPGSQALPPQADALFTMLQRATVLDPAFAPAHAALGNLLARSGFLDEARAAYAAAASRDDDDAASRYALGELATLVRDTGSATDWFAQAFSRRRHFAPAVVRPGARQALMLALAGPWPRNIPLDFLIDDAAWALHRWFLPDDGSRAPTIDVDLVIDTLADTHAGKTAIAQAIAWQTATRIPMINDARGLGALARDRLPETLLGIAGAMSPWAVRFERDALIAALQPHAHRDAAGESLAHLALPILMRPVDAHGGSGLERLERLDAVRDYVQRIEAPQYDCSEYIDYRSADGYYRKYRIMFVDRIAYPYHLAIDEHWMIHYYRSATAATAWMREEEAAFLADPASMMPGWRDVVPAIGDALALDYVGIDCTQLANGTIVVFEADTAMLVHTFDRSEEAAPKRAAVDRIRAAFGQLLAARAAGVSS